MSSAIASTRDSEQCLSGIRAMCCMYDTVGESICDVLLCSVCEFRVCLSCYCLHVPYVCVPIHSPYMCLADNHQASTRTCA